MHRRHVERSPRMFETLADGKLLVQQRAVAMQSVQLRLRRSQHQQTRLGKGVHIKTLGQHGGDCHLSLCGGGVGLDRHSIIR